MASAGHRHLLTVAVEDYFQVGAFHGLIDRDQWYRFEARLLKNTERALQLLADHEIQATFFVLGWIAERWPELIRRIAESGHEVADRGYQHRSLRTFSRTEFAEDLCRSREILERASGRRVLGFRLSDGWLRPDDLWVLEVLAEQGYAYDSSLMPLLRRWGEAGSGDSSTGTRRRWARSGKCLRRRCPCWG